MGPGPSSPMALIFRLAVEEAPIRSEGRRLSPSVHPGVVGEFLRLLGAPKGERPEDSGPQPNFYPQHFPTPPPPVFFCCFLIFFHLSGLGESAVWGCSSLVSLAFFLWPGPWSGAKFLSWAVDFCLSTPT